MKGLMTVADRRQGLPADVDSSGISLQYDFLTGERLADHELNSMPLDWQSSLQRLMRVKILQRLNNPIELKASSERPRPDEMAYIAD